METGLIAIILVSFHYVPAQVSKIPLNTNEEVSEEPYLTRNKEAWLSIALLKARFL